MPDQGDVQTALAALHGACDALASAPWWQLSEDELTDAIASLHRVESRIAAAQIHAVRDGDRRGLPQTSGAKSGAAWLRALIPITPYVAAQRAGLARSLADPELTATAAALSSGDLSPGHAWVVARTIETLAGLPQPVEPLIREAGQELLIEAARRVDPAQLGRAGRFMEVRLDPEASERLTRDECAQQEARTAWLVQESTGMWVLRALLPPLAGAALRTALDVLARPCPASDGSPDPRTAAHRLADAITALADLSLAARAGDPGALPSRGGSPVRLILATDVDAALGTVQTGEPGGWPVSSVELAAAACDAEIVPILTDRVGRPLDVGETIYPFPPRIRRAIEHRDQHCTFDRCEAPPTWCHAHHLIPHGRNGIRGGPTSEDNGTLL